MKKDAYGLYALLIALFAYSDLDAARSKKIIATPDKGVAAARKRLIDQIYGFNPTTKPEKTQSEAYWSIPMLQAMVKARYPFITQPKWQNFINKIIAKEKQYKDTHYVFYHAFNKAWLAPGDFYLALYKRLRPLNKSIDNFRFLRFEPAAAQDLNTFLINEMNAEGLVHDHSNNARASIISVNLSLFGNTNNDGESSFHYFLKPSSHVTVGDWAWKMILDQFDAPKDPNILKQLEALDKTYLSPETKNGGAPSEQAILQIFVPKQIVNKVAYLSYIEGIPRYEKLITWIESLAKDTPHKAMRYANAKEVTEAIRRLFIQNPNHPLKNNILAEIKNNSFEIARVLDEYRKNPEFVPNINDLQARLLFTNEVLLHPTNNVLFFQYDFLPSVQKNAYLKAVDRIADAVAAQVRSQAAQRSKVASQNRLQELRDLARKLFGSKTKNSGA